MDTKQVILNADWDSKGLYIKNTGAAPFGTVAPTGNTYGLIAGSNSVSAYENGLVSVLFPTGPKVGTQHTRYILQEGSTSSGGIFGTSSDASAGVVRNEDVNMYVGPGNYTTSLDMPAHARLRGYDRILCNINDLVIS
jgi:hypothetical protein